MHGTGTPRATAPHQRGRQGTPRRNALCARPGPVGRIAALTLAGLVTLGGLLLASALLDHCASDARFCSPAGISALPAPLPVPAPAGSRDAPVLASAPPGETEPHGPAEIGEGLRPVLAHAFDPLPLGMDTESDRVFVLPPGRNMLEMATRQGAISVDQITLIAVVRQNDTRHALVRLPDGRILRLVQGDRLEGGTVAAISDNALYLLGPDLTPRAFLLGG